MWYTRKDFTLKKKYILSIAFFLWFILAILINSNLSYDNVNEPAINNKFETFAPTKKPASSPKPTNSDYELVFKKGHPVLFSSTDKAHEFWKDKKGVLGWKDRKDKKISYPDTTTNSSGSGVDWKPCVLALNSDMNFGSCYNNYIFGIHIYLDNFKESPNIKLKEALNLAYSYLPHNTLKSYYKFKHSISYKATAKTGKSSDAYYELLYVPIDSNANNFVLDGYSYRYPDIYITFREDSEKHITNIWIELYRGICRSSRYGIAYDDDYKKTKWNYDFFKN